MTNSKTLFQSEHGTLTMYVIPAGKEITPNENGEYIYTIPDVISIKLLQETPRGIVLRISGTMSFPKPKWVSDLHLLKEIQDHPFKCQTTRAGEYYWMSTRTHEIEKINKFSVVLKEIMENEQNKIDAILG